MTRRETSGLLSRAREQIDAMSIAIPSDRFVCHLCLRVLPTAKATIGHYPSRKAGGGRYALQCDDCNNRLGSDIEEQAARYLAGAQWQMTVGPPGGGTVRLPVQLHTSGPTLDLHTTGSQKALGLLRYLTQRTSRPDVWDCRLERPHPDALRMAILAWSFCEWSNYSGYSYSASAGAFVVRQMLLEGSIAIPEAAVVFFDDPVAPPLGDPEPVLVVHAETEVKTIADVDEVLGIGVGWGQKLVGILPAASDTDGAIYQRLVRLMGERKRIRYLPFRPMMRELGFERLEDVMIISDEATGWKMAITDWIQLEERELFSRDAHPRRIDPKAGPRRTYPAGRIEEFYMIEDTLAGLPEVPPRPPSGSRKNERMEKLSSLVGVRADGTTGWHVATHGRLINERPEEFVVFCGARVQHEPAQQRLFTTLVLEGGRVCGKCVTLMRLTPASLRPRPDSL